MYTITIGAHELQLSATAELPAQLPAGVQLIDLQKNKGAKPLMLNLIEQLMAATGESVAQQYWLHSLDLAKLHSTFLKLFYVEAAAGGAVQHIPSNRWLAMQRRGSWDLPKGKMEAGETVEMTALREVEEETGLKNLKIRRFLDCSYHIFKKLSSKKGKEKIVTKLTYWYEMETTQSETTPQVEEDIERLEWLDLADFMQREPIYKNILSLLHKLQAEKN